MIDILCVGNPDLVGDSIGPRVGSLLKQWRCGANIVGTLDDPVLASNYSEQVKKLRRGATVIVVDAVVGGAVGEIEITKGGMIPGESTGKQESVGDYSVKVIMAETIYNLFVAPESRAAALSTRVAKLLSSKLQQK